jgi:hypothetical protein
MLRGILSQRQRSEDIATHRRIFFWSFMGWLPWDLTAWLYFPFRYIGRFHGLLLGIGILE